jgi:hypothetical protein
MKARKTQVGEWDAGSTRAMAGCGTKIRSLTAGGCPVVRSDFTTDTAAHVQRSSTHGKRSHHRREVVSAVRGPDPVVQFWSGGILSGRLASAPGRLHCVSAYRPGPYRGSRAGTLPRSSHQGCGVVDCRSPSRAATSHGYLARITGGLSPMWPSGFMAAVGYPEITFRAGDTAVARSTRNGHQSARRKVHPNAGQPGRGDTRRNQDPAQTCQGHAAQTAYPETGRHSQRSFRNDQRPIQYIQSCCGPAPQPVPTGELKP